MQLVNLRTARSFGLDIPATLQGSATAEETVRAFQLVRRAGLACVAVGFFVALIPFFADAYCAAQDAN